MPVTLDDFKDGTGRMRFPPSVSQETVDWWDRTFRGRSPAQIAERLCRGMPGDILLRFTKISARSEGFALEITASEDNVQVWFHSSTLDLRSKGKGPESNQDDLGIHRAHRGEGLVQRLMANVAAFALRMHVTRITLKTDDVGGYMWARARAVPVGSWLQIRDAVNSRITAFENHDRVDAATARVVRNLVLQGEDDHRLIRALSNLDMMIQTHRGLYTLGQHLLAGVEWEGEINLADRETRTHFRRWRQWQANKLAREARLERH